MKYIGTYYTNTYDIEEFKVFLNSLYFSWWENPSLMINKDDVTLGVKFLSDKKVKWFYKSDLKYMGPHIFHFKLQRKKLLYYLKNYYDDFEIPMDMTIPVTDQQTYSLMRILKWAHQNNYNDVSELIALVLMKNEYPFFASPILNHISKMYADESLNNKLQKKFLNSDHISDINKKLHKFYKPNVNIDVEYATWRNANDLYTDIDKYITITEENKRLFNALMGIQN